jgi:hypothetical protein
MRTCAVGNGGCCARQKGGVDGYRSRKRVGIVREADLRGNVEAKLDILEAKGVSIVDPRQIYLDEAIDESRICRGAVLYPGTRLVGARTFVGPGARVGIEGPAVLENTIIGENSEGGSLNSACRRSQAYNPNELCNHGISH